MVETEVFYFALGRLVVIKLVFWHPFPFPQSSSSPPTNYLNWKKSLRSWPYEGSSRWPLVCPSVANGGDTQPFLPQSACLQTTNRAQDLERRQFRKDSPGRDQSLDPDHIFFFPPFRLDLVWRKRIFGEKDKNTIEVSGICLEGFNVLDGYHCSL